MTIALLERFGDEGSDGLSYIHLFREKNRGKHVVKYNRFQTAVSQTLMCTTNDFEKFSAASGPNYAFSTGALNPLLKIMKSLKYLLAVAGLMTAFTLSAQAHIEFVGAVSFESQPNNNPDSNLAALGQFVDTTGFVLVGNSDDGDFGNPITNPISVMAGSYLVIHYGKGNDGSSKGGGLEFYHVVDGETSVDVPLFGTSEFGNGGISSIREFLGPTVPTPDSGTTAMLLGSSLAGLGLVRRYLKR